MDLAKVAVAMKNYEAQLQRCRDYWRRKNPNPKPRGRPKKIIPTHENEKAEVVEKV
jgi:hypothetical protein